MTGGGSSHGHQCQRIMSPAIMKGSSLLVLTINGAFAALDGLGARRLARAQGHGRGRVRDATEFSVSSTCQVSARPAAAAPGQQASRR